MSKFKTDATYEENGVKIKVGSRDGRRAIQTESGESSLEYHSETRQLINPANPYEICDSEEQLARAIARSIAGEKKKKKK